MPTIEADEDEAEIEAEEKEAETEVQDTPTARIGMLKNPPGEAQSDACLRILLANSLMTHENSIAHELKVAEQTQEDIPLRLIKFKVPNSHKVKVFKKYHWLTFLKLFGKLFVKLPKCSAATPCS